MAFIPTNATELCATFYNGTGDDRGADVGSTYLYNLSGDQNDDFSEWLYELLDANYLAHPKHIAIKNVAGNADGTWCADVFDTYEGKRLGWVIVKVIAVVADELAMAA